jgi:hypothetical protein
MKPTRQNPKLERCSSKGEQLLKGDTRMGRILLVAAAIAALTASGVNAGNFDVLADAGVVKPSAALHIKPGTVVKAEYRAGLKTTSDMDVQSDNLLPEPTSASSSSRFRAKPAIAVRERPSRMAPPPSMARRSEATTNMAANDNSDLDNDLEKGLVIPPPPQKSQEQADTEKQSAPENKPAVEKKPAAEKAAVPVKKVGRKKYRRRMPTVRRYAPSRREVFARGVRRIHKVKPVSQNPWFNPAGNYAASHYNPNGYYESAQTGAPIQRRVPIPDYRPMDQYQANQPAYMPSAPREIPGRSRESRRVVCDGVTVKLAPAAAPAGPPETYPPNAQDDSSGSDLLSAATEIIGMPFAFISSFF